MRAVAALMVVCIVLAVLTQMYLNKTAATQTFNVSNTNSTNSTNSEQIIESWPLDGGKRQEEYDVKAQEEVEHAKEAEAWCQHVSTTREPTTLIYNRIPKAGSTSMISVFKGQQQKRRICAGSVIRG